VKRDGPGSSRTCAQRVCQTGGTGLAFLVPLVVPLPAMFLGLFTSAIQALIFATLAAYYIGEAVHEEHH